MHLASTYRSLLDSPGWFNFNHYVEEWAQRHANELLNIRRGVNEPLDVFTERIIQEQSILTTVRYIMEIPRSCIDAANTLEDSKETRKTNVR
jgi:hypothetical protein